MFADPEKNIGLAQVTEGTRVADFGAGSGAYSLAAARQAGTTGAVYAIDIQNNVLDRLAKEAQARGLPSIHTIWGNVEKLGGSKLADQSVDIVLVSNLLFQVEGKYTLALEAKRILKPGGRVMVIDWLDSYGGLGPTTAAVIKPEEVKKIFAEAGFSAIQDFSAGAHHYGLIFKKPEH